MHDGAVEATRYPRNPLDVLAQQIVAMAAMDEWRVDDLFDAIRRAAPFAELSRSAFEGVLDMLSGRYPSDEFAELRPRVTWDRIGGTIVAREGAKRVAVANGGTIPDRGLFGVFLLGAPKGAARVGELDEEMVFESRSGETFVLGASTWRIEEITHDRVIVSPAPGQPGKMPFWKGDRAGRPLELGLAIGRLTRDLLRVPPQTAIDRLTREHDLDASAAENLLQYLRDQMSVARAVPDAATVVVERVRDELGDWRVCVLSPRGGRIHAPWAMAAAAKIRQETGVDVETLWGDDGFVVRFPDVDQPPDPALLLPDPDEAQALVVRQLGGTALFAAKFRENAARSLLLPKRRPGMRAPLWQQRKKAADLLAVAARYGSFPVLLETYRECLRDFFDMPALVATLTDVRSRKIRVATVDSEKPSPFAASLLFSYVASFLYDGDAPLAERRAQALAVDQAQLRELLGDAELRELLDGDAIDDIERQLQRLDPGFRAKSADAVHDMLLSLGDLDAEDISARAATAEIAASVDVLVKARRALSIPIAGDVRFIAVEDAARYRDALGVRLPPGIPESLLEPVADPLADLALRYARTHAPFTAADFASAIRAVASLRRIAARPAGERRASPRGRVPSGRHAARVDGPRRPSHDPAPLAREAAPRDRAGRSGGSRAAGDHLAGNHQAPPGRGRPARCDRAAPGRADRGLDPRNGDSPGAPRRLRRRRPRCRDGGGRSRMGRRRAARRTGRTDRLVSRRPRREPAAAGRGPTESDARRAIGKSGEDILAYLEEHGASFFGQLHEAAGGGYPGETVDVLWDLVWRGAITNDTFHALRAFTAARAPRRRIKRPAAPPVFRSRRLVPPTAEGRWSLVHRGPKGSATRWAAAIAQQLLNRHGILTREAAGSDNLPGGFGSVYPVLKAMEEHGRIRRGYFVAGLGATQFALPGALELLRSLRVPDDEPEIVVLSATDPANPYGTTLKVPSSAANVPRGFTRTVGASVILVDGALVAYLGRGDRQLLTWLPEAEPQRSRAGRVVARVLIDRARTGVDAPRGMLIEEIDGMPPATHAMARWLAEAGFIAGAMGFQATFKSVVGSR